MFSSIIDNNGTTEFWFKLIGLGVDFDPEDIQRARTFYGNVHDWIDLRRLFDTIFGYGDPVFIVGDTGRIPSEERVARLHGKTCFYIRSDSGYHLFIIERGDTYGQEAFDRADLYFGVVPIESDSE